MLVCEPSTFKVAPGNAQNWSALAPQVKVAVAFGYGFEGFFEGFVPSSRGSVMVTYLTIVCHNL